jgi:hypothetical protein
MELFFINVVFFLGRLYPCYAKSFLLLFAAEQPNIYSMFLHVGPKLQSSEICFGALHLNYIEIPNSINIWLPCSFFTETTKKDIASPGAAFVYLNYIGI